MDSPVFSIIIPTYNRAKPIRLTLESALQQKFGGFEVIVVDDGSTDNTEEVVKSIQDHRIRYHRQANRERGAARNKGVSLARGIFITFCDSDDVMYPDYLSNANEMIGQYPDLRWLHAGYEIRRRKGKPLPMRINPDHIVTELAKGNPLSCMGVFIRTDIILQHPFNENRQLSGSEDWELWLRIAAHYPLVTDPRISSALVQHDERSVLQASELKLQLRKYLSIGYAFDDEKVKQVFGPYKRRMYAYFDTYISLHLALSGKNTRALKYLFTAAISVPACIFDRRVLAIVRLYFNNIAGRKS